MRRKKAASIKKTRKALKPFSVLLQYPSYIAQDGPETFYTFVKAANPGAALEAAQAKAVKRVPEHFACSCGWEPCDDNGHESWCNAKRDASDFELELMLRGHHRGISPY